MNSDSVTIRVPASTSNLGPGFDTLGIALNLYNLIRVTRANGRGIDIVSPIDEKERPGATAMIAEAAALFFKTVRKKEFPFDISLRGEIPIARGLGSSVTVRLGVVAALNELAGARWPREKLLDVVSALEHHPDNAAPAVFGGFCVAGLLGESVRCLHFPVAAHARFVALIPRFEISTERARRLVPSTFSKADTVHNLNRAALLSSVFARGDLASAQGLFEDRVHQPYRQKLIPQLARVICAGEKAGAVGGWLSGSGSTIICLALKNPAAISRAMQRQLPDSDIKILRADSRGMERVKS